MGYSVKPNTFTMDLGFTAFGPADATTYYFGAITPTAAPTTTAAIRTCKIPVNATLVGAVINCAALGGAGSGESTSMYVRLNNTTDITLSTAVLYNATNTQFVITGLNSVVTTSDYFEIKMVTPTWVTNPSTTATAVTLLFNY